MSLKYFIAELIAFLSHQSYDYKAFMNKVLLYFWYFAIATWRVATLPVFTAVKHFRYRYSELLKGKIRSRFKLNQYRKSKQFRTEQWKFDVSRIKKKKDMKFRISVTFIVYNIIFLNSPYEYANEWVDDVNNCPCILFTEMTKIPYFSYEKVKLA